ncbi:MAG: helix-turn-helix domain-containing protein [Candidatus Dactylopiibacterium sp.]|nr:helix-turn-helix domain-containing protein [Candidatus Dactylopiibacterium sp.]
METLGQRITRLREALGLSRRALADACKVSHVAVGKWETEDTENIKLANLLRLAKALRVSIGELVQGQPSGQALFASSVQEPIQYYGNDADEQLLLSAYRTADDTGRLLLLTQANALLGVHKKKSA